MYVEIYEIKTPCSAVYVIRHKRATDKFESEDKITALTKNIPLIKTYPSQDCDLNLDYKMAPFSEFFIYSINALSDLSSFTIVHIQQPNLELPVTGILSLSISPITLCSSPRFSP